MASVRLCGVYCDVVVLDGELAVPCTRNPLQRGRIPFRGSTAQDCGSRATLMVRSRSAGPCESGQDRKVAALSSKARVNEVADPELAVGAASWEVVSTKGARPAGWPGTSVPGHLLPDDTIFGACALVWDSSPGPRLLAFDQQLTTAVADTHRVAGVPANPPAPFDTGA